MLLSLMRRQAKSWLIKFLIAIIAVVFIFYFGYSFTSKEGVKVAYVNGEIISGIEYQKAYRNLLEALQRNYKNAWNENLIQVFDLKNRAFESLVNEKLISQEARRIGLEVTDKEIQEKILSYPSFQFNGRFDEARYRSLLDQNGMKPEDFEAEIARQILQEKVDQFLTTFLQVTDQEVLDQYTFFNRGIKLSLVQFKPDKFKSTVTVDPEKMAAYFDEHKEDYREPAKIKIAYITIDPAALKETIKPTEQQIREYYEDNIERYKEPEEVKARHILFRLNKDATPEEEEKVKEKALSVLKKAREGADFAELAKQYSEGPTKEKGGELGYFPRGRMVKAFDEAVFNMKKGEISDLVKTPFGYHIILVEDIKEARTKSLEEVKKQIADTLMNTTNMDLAYEKAMSLYDQMPYDVDLAKYAETQKMPINQTDYFAQYENIPDIIGDEKLRQSLFSLDKGDVSELVEFNNKFYIIQVVDKKPSYLPKLDQVEKKVKDDYIMYLAKNEAKSAAEKYLAQLKAGESWDELAKKDQMKIETTDFITRNDVVPQIGYDQNFQDVAFGLSEKKRYPEEVFENARGAFVFRWEGQRGIDEKKFQEEKASYRDSLLSTRRQLLFRDWLDSLKRKAEIKDLRSGSQV